MKANAIILHGRPDKSEYYDAKLLSNSNQHWLPWLAQQLLIRDIFALTPEMQYAYRPRYDEWVREVERYEIHEKTMLVGHSCGAGFWVRYLSDRPDLRVQKLVLVAPWLNPDDNPASDTADFFHFSIDPLLASRVTHGISIVVSDDDQNSVHESVRMIQKVVTNTTLRRFHDKGHFCFEQMGTVAFPELLEEVLQ